MHNIKFHLKLDIKHGYLIKYFEEIIVLLLTLKIKDI